MTEMGLTYIAGIKLLIASLIGFLYALAGRGVRVPVLGKIRRSVWLPLILCLSWVGFMFWMDKFSWRLLGAIALSWPLYYGTMKGFAYGHGSWLRKIFTRIPQQFIVGAVHGGSCLLVAIVTQLWGVYIAAVLLPCIALGLFGGLFDHDLHASWKEALTGILIFLPALFLI